MRCSRDGWFMRRSTVPRSSLWICRCGEVRSSDPGTNFGLMMLGFAHKAAKP